MRKFLTDQRGVSMLMVVGFLALAVPVVTAALSLAGTLSLDSLVKNRLVRDQYSSLGIKQYVEHVVDEPGFQEWVDETGCDETVEMNGEEITLSCDPPDGPPGEPPSLSNRQFRTFKEVSPTTANPDTMTDFTYTVMVYNASGVDKEKKHGYLGHGYWKQPHHLDAWTGYAPDDLYNETFELAGPYAYLPPADLTLMDALREGGGREIAFRRAAVTALLNSANPDINYPWSEIQIGGYVREAYFSTNYQLYTRTLNSRNDASSFFNDDDDDGDDSDDEGQQKVTRIYDGLPPGFDYRPGTSFINGVQIGDPTIVSKRDKDYEGDNAAHGAGNLGPSYWKHDDNYVAWTGYLSTDNFAAKFGVVSNPFTNRTLIAVLTGPSGGDERKMQQEAVAGLLNAAHPNIVYQYTEAQVKALVVQAYAAGSPDFKDIWDLLKDANKLAHYIPSGRTLMMWDLEDLNVRIPSGEDMELVFGAKAKVPEGNYCNEAWVEPGFKDHDDDDDDDDDGRGRGSGSDMTARVQVGDPGNVMCPGEAMFVTTRIDAPVALSGGAHRYTYTIELENVGTTTLHVAKISDILPFGFSYVGGSTDGITNANPSVSNLSATDERKHLEWSAPFTGNPPEIEPGETLTLSFEADATLTLGNYANEVWIYLTEFTGIDDANYTWPTAIVRVMDVMTVTATDSEGNVIGTYQVWVGTDSTIVR